MEHALIGRQERGGGPATGPCPSHCARQGCHPPHSRCGSHMHLEGQSRQTIIPSLKLAGTSRGLTRLYHQRWSVGCLLCGRSVSGSREKHRRVSRGAFGSLSTLSDDPAFTTQEVMTCSRLLHTWLEQMPFAGNQRFRILCAF